MKSSVISRLKGLFISVVVAATLALLVEIVVFNWSSIESLAFQEAAPSESRTYDSNGYHCIEYSFDDEDIKDVELSSDLPDDFDGYSYCSAYVIDEGSSVYYKLGDFPLKSDAVYRIHPTGKVKKLLITACPATPKTITEAGTPEAYSKAKSASVLQTNGVDNSEQAEETAQSDIDVASKKAQAKDELNNAALDKETEIAGVQICDDGEVKTLESLPVGSPLDYKDQAALGKSLYSTAGDNVLEPGEFYVNYSSAFNLPIPLDVSKKRLLLLFFGTLLVFALRPGSELYKRSYKNHAFLLCLLSLASFVAVLIVATHVGHMETGAMNQRQYIELAKALAHGQLYIDVQPSASLMSMDNPYDTNARYSNNVEYLWDYAYFNGHYYVYFGILPVLIYQLPFYLLTGGEFPVAASVAISSVVMCVGVAFLLKKICQRWLGEITQAMFLILLLVMLCGSWAAYACAVPGHYVLPIVTGLACLVWGLVFWIDSTRGGDINIPKAIVGSLLVALTLACRPQLMAGGLIGVVLLVSCFKKMDKKRFFKSAIIAIAPFVFIFMLIGMYNAARFGSPFDFGANYNLTTNDMTHRAFSIDRVPLALFAYLFQSPSMIFTYPYLVGTSLASDYYGLTISETMWGGLLCLSPVLLCSCLLVIKRFRERMTPMALSLSLCSLLVGFVLVVFDANGAGILMRYFMDFGFFFSLAAVFCIGQIWRVEGEGEALAVMEDGKMRFRVSGLLLVFLIFITFILQGMWLFNNA